MITILAMRDFQDRYNKVRTPAELATLVKAAKKKLKVNDYEALGIMQNDTDIMLEILEDQELNGER